jgi:ferredoxin-NADP reductase
MPIYKLKLIDRNEVARGTKVFVFEKPKGFTFKPGQYGGFTLIDPPETDVGGITRRFSLSSAPDDKHIVIATRIQNTAYKRVLNALPLDSVIKFAGPTGTFILHEDHAIPAVLIAGGIGITPFHSMIKHATQHKLSQPIFLFYGNQTQLDAAFLPELFRYESENPNLKLIATLEKPNGSWKGETGYITATMIKKYIHDLFIPHYYICGSPAMVTALQELLAELGVDEDKIKVEDFPGY